MSGTVTWRELVSQPDSWTTLLGRLESGALALPLDTVAFDEFLLLGTGMATPAPFQGGTGRRAKLS